MKKIRKSIALLLVVVMIFGLTVPSYATEFVKKTNNEEIPINLLKRHKDIISGRVPEASVGTYSEYDIIKKLENKSTVELLSLGYSTLMANQISTGKIEEVMLSEIFERSKMSTEQLSDMGYSNEEITELQSLTGDETLSDISTRGLFANCTCYNILDGHYYKQSTGKTYMVVAYGWEWDKFPAIKLTDCAGVGWNHEFTPDDSLDNDAMDYNLTYIGYCETKDSPASSVSRVVMREKYLQTSECTVPMKSSGNTALFGVGNMALSQVGCMYNVKFSFKYAHNTIGATPSVGLPWSVGFSFESAEDIFTPPSVLYHDYPTIIS